MSLVRLKPLDVEVMKQLHHKVNIIPLIAKADTMTAEECRDFKKTVSSVTPPVRFRCVALCKKVCPLTSI